jgi:transglutaminase-like putative cysteine protease
MNDSSSSTLTRWWDLPAASLLVVALLTAASRLVATDWTSNLEITQTLALAGVVAGLAIGQSRFSTKLSFFLATIYGAFAVPYMIGHTMGPGIPWTERLVSINGRLQVIVNQLASHSVVTDSLLFQVLMSVLFWTLSVYAGYTLTRHGDAWRAILPAGLALFVIHSFDPLVARRTWYLAIYLFFSLVLVARMTYLKQHNRWQESRTALPPHLGLDFIRFTLLVAGVIVIFSWTIPALAQSLPPAERVFQPVRLRWYEFRDQFNNAFASLRSTVGMVSDFYGNSLILGRGNQLTDTQMFVVKPLDAPPPDIRFYWRAKSYDTYTDGNWRSTSTSMVNFNPQTDGFTNTQDQARWIGSFEFIPQTNIATIFTPDSPLWVSRPSKVEFSKGANGNVDVVSFRADPVINAGEVYQVTATLSNASVVQLEKSGTNYPQWVKDRYLQLPDTITPRTRQLAQQITNGYDNPYDKAVAITNYLRQNIHYSQTIPDPPANQEIIDWFLFDLRQGFCNYYATAEVVLLRAVGVPARWSVGYAEGQALQDGSFVVRQRDAHAWPEVYFPNYGWVEFEPTASQPVLFRRAGSANDAIDPNSPSTADQASLLQQQEDRMNRLREIGLGNSGGAATGPATTGQFALMVGSAFLGIGILMFLAIRMHVRINFAPVPIWMEKSMLRMGFRPPKRLTEWSRQASLPAIPRAYLEISRALARLGQATSPSATPNERASALIEDLPAVIQPTNQLVQRYQMHIFSTHIAENSDQEDALEAGRQIRNQSFKAVIQRFFQRLLARVQRPASRTARDWHRET